MADHLTIPLPFEAALALTWHCNLNCPFCFEQKWRADRIRELTADEWLNVLQQLSAMCVLRLRISGGEPLLSPAFPVILQSLASMKMRFTLITNGTLMTEKIADQIAATRHCDRVQISIDGPEHIHDAIRGSGNFRKSTAAIKMLADKGITVKVNTVLTRASCAELPSVVETLENLPVETYRLNPVSGEEDNSLSQEDQAKAAAWLIRKSPELKKLGKKSFPFSLLKLLREPEEMKEDCGFCSKSRIRININPDGSVVPCSDYDTCICGNVREQSLTDIWRGETMNQFQSRCRRDVPMPSESCVGCRYLASCRRFCPPSKPLDNCFAKMYQLLQKEGIEI